jgi:hypothetical protein
LPPEIADAAKAGNLVLFVGAGVSRLVGLPAWDGLAKYVLEDIRKKGFLNYFEIQYLEKLDPKKQLSIADIIAKENKFKLDFKKYLIPPESECKIYEYVNSIGCSYVTTNYDDLIKPFLMENEKETPSETKRIYHKEKMLAGVLNERSVVVHLHGFMEDRDSMVVTAREYLEHYENANVQQFLGELFAKKTVLFIGYGLEEAEILEHILRRGSVGSESERKRFLIDGFFGAEQSLYSQLESYYNKSFGVHLIGFIRDNEDYRGLETMLRSWKDEIEVRDTLLTEDYDFLVRTLKDE